MCSTPSVAKPVAPVVPDVTPEAPTTPGEAPTSNTSASADAKRRNSAAGLSSKSTILTGARGVTDEGATSAKTLLGQ